MADANTSTYLRHATEIYISDAPNQLVSDMHMIPSHDISEALKISKGIVKNGKASITAIPDGVAV